MTPLEAGLNGLIAQVVPDLATFAVDDGFSYVVPMPMTEQVSVGSIVRVPLGSRRIRGYVIALRKGIVDGLKPIVSISGDEPIFGPSLLQTLRWAALHYVAPLSVLLNRSAPPNLPRGAGTEPVSEVPQRKSALDTVSSEAAARKHVRPTCLIQGRDYGALIAGLANAPVRAGRNVAVVAPTAHETASLAAYLRPSYGDHVLEVTSSLPAADVTKSWVTSARDNGVVVVGTSEIALWPLGEPALWVVVEEGRRAMKAKQTPTLQVHELVRKRALIERSALVVLGAVPTIAVIGRGAAIVEPPGRAWPLVEVVDRREDAGGGRSLTLRTLRAIRAAVREGAQVFVFVSRRGYAPAFRCVRCRRLRRCRECGSGPDRGEVCRRCGAVLGACVECGGKRFEPLGAGMGRVVEELTAQLNDPTVGEVGSGRQVIVGSERDIPAVPETALSVVVDADSLLMAPNFRAEEDGLRTLVRVALTVARGRGRRALVQTGQPDHRALGALRSGHPIEYLRALGEERARDMLPPSGQLIAVEITGNTEQATEDLSQLASDGVQIHGPESGGGRTRWFLRGENLQSARIRLRPLVQSWRDAGLRVRIDADPVDL